MPNHFHNELLNTFDCLGQEFQNSLQETQEQEQNFEAKLGDFQKNIKQHLIDAKESLPKSNPMSGPITNFANSLDDINNKWKDSLKKQDKGVKFRAGFNDSLLVFVFGKVKSGKSSLGNYIAWGNTDPTDDLKNNATHQPKYFSAENTGFKRGDANKEAEHKREFKVGATETTSSIQGFSLPGLTWIDSPGLHSINEENGKLAKDYVEHSDLILYITKSDGPGRESDFEEITKLCKKGKKLLILITGSDQEEEDELESGELINQLVMKTEEVQKQQQDEIRKKLTKIFESQNQGKNIAEDIEVVSISARYAQEHPNDIEKYKKSGMATFFEILGDIASKDSIKLKQKVPLQNFSNYLKSFDGDIEKFKNMITDFQKPVEQIKDGLPKKIFSATKNIQEQLASIIDDERNKLEEYRDEERLLQTEIEKSLNHIQHKHNELLRKAQEKILNDLLSNLTADMIKVVENSAFLQLPEFKNEHTKERIAVSINPGNRKRNSGIGGIIGGMVGGFAGALLGPAGIVAGVAIGSSIGGAGGYLSGNDASINHQDINVKTGDNFCEIMDKLLDTISSSVESQMQSFEDNTLAAALSEAEKLIQNIQQEIEELKQYFDKQQKQIQNKLKS